MAAMGQLLLLLLVGMVLSQSAIESYQTETQNMDPDSIQALGQQIQIAIGMKLSSYKRDFDAKFDRLEQVCLDRSNGQVAVELLPDDEKQVQKLVDTFVDQLLRFSESAVDNVRDKMVEALNNTMGEIEVNMQPVWDDISGMKSQMSKLVTQDEVADLQTKLNTLGTEATTQIKQEMENLPTKEDLQNHNNLLAEQLQEVASAIGNQSTCGDKTKVQEVLEQLTKSDRDLEELSGYLRDASQNRQCETTFDSIVEYLETLTETMTGNSQSMSDLEGLVTNMQTEFVTHLEGLEDVAEKLAEGPEPQPDLEQEATATSSLPGIQVRSECLNSNFLGGGRSLDICNAAVRFRKCHLVFVAFHCCRSCTDAGLISSPPSNYNAPRTVPVLQALKSLKP